MLALKRTMILGIVVFLIVWTVLLSIRPVVGASETWPPTLVSPANNAWVAENKPTFKWIFSDPNLTDSQSGFNLQISNATTDLVVQNITVKSSTQNYTLTTALDDWTYYWKVRTNDTSGAWSDWSIIWIVKIDTTPPNPVTDVSVRLLTKFAVRELEIGGQIVNITWTASDEPIDRFKQYEIYVSTDPDDLGTLKDTIVARWTSYYKTEVGPKGLDPDTTYYISVVVVDQAGWSSEAATVSVKTTSPLNWPLIGGIAVGVEVAIVAIFVVIKLFIKKK